MSRETQVPAIPAPSDSNLVQALQAIKSSLDVREGRLGDPLDQFVTLRELKALGLVEDGAATTTTVGGVGTLPVIGTVGNGVFGPGNYNETTDLTTPPQPTGLTATTTFSTVVLQWTGAAYSNPAYTEVWRSATNALGSAVLIGTTTGSIFSDPVGRTSQTYYYWIRFVSMANVTGPYNATNGTAASTSLIGGQDLSNLIITADKIASGAIDLGGNKITGLLANANMAVISDPTKIADSLIGNTKLADLAITAGKIANGAIDLSGTKITGLLANANMAVISDPTKIADFLISNTKLADLAVTAGKIASGAITLTKFASGIEPVGIFTGTLPTTKSTETIVFGGKLYRWTGSAYTAAVDSTDISGQIQAAQIAALEASKITGQLTNTQIADLSAAKLTGQITETQISNDAISTPKLAAGAITSAKIAANTITASNIAAGTITSSQIAAGTITGSNIAAGTIAAGNIAAGTITGDRIAANTITGSNIVADTITAAQIAAGAITASELAAGAVTAGKIATGSIIANDGVIANGAITNALIANAAIGSAQIQDAAITSAKIGSAAIGTAAIQTGAITTALIANAAIGSAQIADAAITSAKIGNLAVGNAAIQNLAVTNSKIADLAADKITAGTITAAIDLRSPIVRSGAVLPGNAGFYLGDYGGVNQFYIGNGSTGVSGRALQFDGTNAIIRGGIYAYFGTIGSILIDATGISSSNYVSGSTGFSLNQSGAAEFSNVTVRGSVYSTNGQIGGVNITGSGLSSSNFGAGTGWSITGSGNATFNNIYARGDIEASTLKANTVMVNTVNIAGNAVTIPLTNFDSTYISHPGTGYLQVMSYTFSQPSGGKIIIQWTCKGFAVKDANFRIFCNGTEVGSTRVGTGAFQDQPFAMGFADANAGSNTVIIYFETYSGGRDISDQKLIVLGAQR
jgi:hypothetical protein